MTALFEPPVRWQLVRFLALTGLVAAVAAAALVVTAGPLLHGLITRLHRRDRAFAL